MNYSHSTTIDWVHFKICRAESGPGFASSLRHFRQDGIKALSEIESALQERNALALITPAHLLQRQARQFGGLRLALLAERIESVARHCVETGRSLDELSNAATDLRRVFGETLRHFDRATDPATGRQPPLARRTEDLRAAR